MTHVNHRCFIQPIVDEDETKAGGLRMVAEDVEEEHMLEYEEEENEIDNGGGKEKVEPTKNCSSCRRTNGTCPKFATYVTAEVYCDQCNESFTDRTVMTRTSEERKVFATNLESVAKLTSSTPKRNITAITLFAQTVKK